jgi:glycosyltransferase involved in cell wall biosynthesis
MRIAIAGAHHSVVGGAEVYQRQVIPELLDRGHHVALLHEVSPAPDAPTVTDGAVDLSVWNVAELGRSEALRRLQAWKPDVAYVHGLRDPELEAALVSQYSTALFAHSYYGTCGSGTKRHAYPGIQMCTRRFGVVCALYYYPRRCGGLGPGEAVRTYRLQRRRERLLRRHGAVLVASTHMQQEYQRHDLPAGRIHLAPLPPMGIRPDPNPPEVREGRGRLVLAGRLTRLKGGDHLLQAIRLASRDLRRDLSLTVIGSGPERQRLETLAQSLNLAVDFPGWVGMERRNDIFRGADLLAIPSLWPEPYGLVGPEAQCVGLPAVGYGVGGIVDWLIPGVTGELAPADPPTAAGLAAAIVRALGDSSTHARLRLGAWQQAQKHQMATHVDTLIRVFRSVTGSEDPPS